MRWWARVLVGGLLASTVALPWATYRNLATGHTSTFGAGAFAIVIVCGALGAMGCSLMSSARARLVALLLGGAMVPVTAAAALTAIKTANDAAQRGIGPSETAYAAGSGVAIAAAILLTVLIALAYAEARAGATARHPTTPPTPPTPPTLA